MPSLSSNRPLSSRNQRTCLVTGGLGFVGSNLCNRLLTEGWKVRIFDNASRRGVTHNLRWLEENHRGRFQWINADIRNFTALSRAAKGVDVVYHLASQVAVTTSVLNPREDFEINALGAFNVLEAAREQKRRPIIVFTSTNKVYGGMESEKVKEGKTKYSFANRPRGISESFPLDFHSPYGCSKGCADQYVHDYGRIYDIPTVVLRMSCIYGNRQFGNEDQGWVAHFVINALQNKHLTIYGDGKQVRDLLYIDDLVNVLCGVVRKIKITSGQVYNVGGGPSNAISVWREFGPMLKKVIGSLPKTTYKTWRAGDQPIYISDITKISKDLGWTPKINLEEGVRRLVAWAAVAQKLLGKKK